MPFFASGKERPTRSMITLLFVSSIWALASAQGTGPPPPASTDRAYLFDFFTCPECRDGLNRTAAMRCYDPEDSSVSYVFFFFFIQRQ